MIRLDGLCEMNQKPGNVQMKKTLGILFLAQILIPAMDSDGLTFPLFCMGTTSGFQISCIPCTIYIVHNKNEGSRRRDEYKVMMMIEGNGERIKSLRRRREESTEWVT